MASSTVIHPTDSADWKPDSGRLEVALEAAFQIEPCVELGLDTLEEEFDSHATSATLRAILLRVHALNQVIMGAVGDRNESLEDLHSGLRGR